MLDIETGEYELDTDLRITAREGRIEIEPVPRQVQIVQKGPLRIAVPVEEGPALTEATVEQVRREMRERGHRDRGPV